MSSLDLYQFRLQNEITKNNPPKLFSQIVDVTEEKYEYPLLRPAKKCTAQVRAKKEVCITNKIWSDWSEPVIIYDGKLSYIYCV